MFSRFACRATRRALPDYVTNRLSIDERDRIERHLAVCGDCSSRRHSLHQAAEFAGTARRDPLPTSLTSWEDLKAQIETTPQPATIARRRPSPLLLVGAATTACAATVIFWSVRAQRSHPIGPINIAAHPGIDTDADRHNAMVSPSVVARRNDRQANRPRVMEAGAQPTPGTTKRTSAPQLAEETATPERVQPGLIAPTNPSLIPKPAANEADIVRIVREDVDRQRQNDVAPELQEPAANTSLPALAVEPGQQPAMPMRSDDIAYVNADVATSLKQWTTRPITELRQLDVALQQQVAGGDNFVTVPLPLIAGQGDAATKSAVVVQQREAAIIDARLVRKVSVQAKGISFFDLCERLRRESGVRVTANRCVADDKITLYCHPRPLRDLMRQISRHFGFTWIRKGDEGNYEYELTQTVRSKLLEEGMRERDEEAMLLAIDRAMEPYRPFSGLSLAQLNALPAHVANAAIQPLFQLQHGGLVPMNLYFALSGHELDTLRTGQTLTVDLKSNAAALLPPSLVDGIRHSFDEGYERERHLAAQGDPQPPIPDASSPLTATLQLDRSKPGEFALKGDLSDGQTGLGSNLAIAKSPAYEIHNARDNAELAHDPALQRPVTVKPTATCMLTASRYPDTEGLHESAGSKVTTGDVMEALYKATGLDVISDYYSHLHTPADVMVSDVRLYDALNKMGDQMRMRWTRQDGWVQFRTATFYYDRPQEVPNRLLERWQSARARQGVLTPDDLSEIAQLPDAQLDSLWMAQGAEAIYGLWEWQMAQIAQLRSHWRFMAGLSEEQRRDACSEQGLAYERMTPEQKIHFMELAYDGDANRPGYNQVTAGNLRLLYALGSHPIGEGASYAIMPTNPVLFIYSCNVPGMRKRLAVVGPFNAIYGMLEEHMTPEALEIVPGHEDR
jgi:hypothetical protein